MPARGRRPFTPDRRGNPGGLLAPALHVARDRVDLGVTVMRIAGRPNPASADALRSFLSARHEQAGAPFRNADARAFPHLALRELTSRMRFAFGAIARTTVGVDALRLMAGGRADVVTDGKAMMQRIGALLVPGLRVRVSTVNATPVDIISDDLQAA